MDLAETRSEVKEQLGTAKVLCTAAAKSRRTPVALKLEDKQAIVAEVTEAAGSALSAVLADYRGLNVGQMTELRREGAQANVYVRVIRNTLARRAVAGTEFECLKRPSPVRLCSPCPSRTRARCGSAGAEGFHEGQRCTRGQGACHRW